MKPGPAQDPPLSEVERLSAIIGVQQEIAAAGHDPDVVMPLITERTQRLTRADGAIIELIEGAEMVYRTASGTAAPSLGMRLGLHTSLSGMAVKTGEVLRCDDAEQDARVDREACRKVGCRSLIVVPLRHQGATVGVLKVMAARPAAFSDSDVHTLRLMASFLATTMSQAAEAEMRKSLVRKLAEQQELLQRIIDHTPLIIAFIDREYVYRWNNAAHCTLMGLSAEQIMGRSVFELQPGLRMALEPLYRQVIETGQPYSLTSSPVALRVDAGEKRLYLDVSYLPTRDEAGRIDGILVLAADVTSRVEQERFQAERIAALQEADRIKDEFVAVVSHELRTPLTSMRGALGLLASGMVGAMSPRAQSLLEIANQSSDRLLRLVNDILDLSRLDCGQMELHRETCEPDAIVSQAIAAMRPMAEDAGVTLNATVSAPSVSADPGRLHQVLTNLLHNAIKFAPPATQVRVVVQPQGEEVLFQVIDQGRGIPRAMQEHVFMRFKQVDASDAREKGGSGLGLAICHDLVEAHGGRIGVTSEEGAGSTFWFTLPSLST